MTTVLIVLMESVHLLDFAGPAQVFDAASRDGLDFTLQFVGEHPRPSSAQGLRLDPPSEWPTLGPEDIILVPGGRAERIESASRLGDDAVARLRRHVEGGGRVASVCSGAVSLGVAGLLDGRRCTTHHSLQHGLTRLFPRARVVKDVLFTVDGPVSTSAGIASGIDLALDIVARQDGPAAAARIARGMVMYTRRNGNAPQESALLRHRAHLVDVVHRAQDEIDERFRETLRLQDLAASVGLSPRGLSRAFDAALGMTPLRYQQTLRVETAQRMIERGVTVETAARQVGFQNARMLRRLRSRARGDEPAASPDDGDRPEAGGPQPKRPLT